MSISPYRIFISAILVAVLIGACGSETLKNEKPLSDSAPLFEVKTPDQINFRPLNPARGDRSPQAGQLWGDIREDVASGVILTFADGFSSPPHIHNIGYRAVVIEGGIHNDDPSAAKLWMGSGSYWTQPAGEVHITAAKPGGKGVSFLEIFSGPYLVKPSSEVFDAGERPINMTPDNIVWLNAKDSNWLKGVNNRAEISVLWRSSQGDDLVGAFLKLPGGESGSLIGPYADLRSVIIKGDVRHKVKGTSSNTKLSEGGYFMSGRRVVNNVTCEAETECWLYVRTAQAFDFKMMSE